MQEPMRATSPRLKQQRAVVLTVRPGGNNSGASAARTSQPWAATHVGVAIGTLSSAAFHCNNDPMVSPEHGTLECTAKYGVWVYVDHSVTGTRLNDSRRVHQEAVVVRDGDRLLVGNTEIELRFHKPASSSSSMSDRDNEDSLSPLRHRTTIDRHRHQATESSSVRRSSQSVVAPSPITWPTSAGKLPERRLEPPTIVTSGDRLHPSAAPPEYTASPIPGSNWRRKRHSMTAFTPSPAPPPPGSALGGGVGSGPNQLHPFLRPRPLVPSAPSTPPRQVATRPSAAVNAVSPHQPYNHLKWTLRPEDNNEGERKPCTHKIAPPPLDYSSSPMLTPTLLLQRAQQPQTSSLPPQSRQQDSPHAHVDASAPSTPKSRRDNLRIQVSKKMAGAVDSSKRTGVYGEPLAARPTAIDLKIPLPMTPPPPTTSGCPGTSSNNNNNNSEFDFHSNLPPSSPVAHKDILRRNKSLLNILKNKYKEEQLLKQQQEEWMRHNFNLGSAAHTPPMSPIKKRTSRDNRTDEDDDAEHGMSDLEIPPRAPALLRTISLGLHQASPRLTAAVLASRARVGSFDGSKKHSNQRSPQTATNASQGSDGFSSVGSSVSTEPACHRRVTRSLSISSDDESDGDNGVSSAELSEFMGYEDDVDGITSFTTHALYASNEYKSSASKGDDSTLQFSSYSSSTTSSSRTTATTNDRFSIDIVTSPEDDDGGGDVGVDVLQSPARGITVAPQFARKATAGATSNLFDATAAKRLYHRNPDKSPIDVSPEGSHAAAPARRFRRIQSP